MQRVNITHEQVQEVIRKNRERIRAKRAAAEFNRQDQEVIDLVNRRREEKQ